MIAALKEYKKVSEDGKRAARPVAKANKGRGTKPAEGKTKSTKAREVNANKKPITDEERFGGKTRDQVLEDMLPLVRHISAHMAMFLPSHVSKDDLLGAGIIGLINAVDRYSNDKDCSLQTYASIRIRGSILDELRKLDWVPRSVHRDARHLASVQESLAHQLGREPSDEEVRMELGMDRAKYNAFLERVKPVCFFSLQEPVGSSEESDPLSFEDVVADPRSKTSGDVCIHEEDKHVLLEQLELLPERQKQVLSLYYLEDLRLKEIAEILGLTESRVSQIHTLAVSRLRKAVDSYNRAALY